MVTKKQQKNNKTKRLKKQTKKEISNINVMKLPLMTLLSFLTIPFLTFPPESPIHESDCNPGLDPPRNLHLNPAHPPFDP
jgi:hypothetical protein